MTQGQKITRKRPRTEIKDKTIEEGFIQKVRQTVVIAFLGNMAVLVHLDCVAEKLIKAGRASITVSRVLIK